MSQKYPQPPDSQARSGDSNYDVAIEYMSLQTTGESYSWRESDMFAAYVKKPCGSVIKPRTFGPVEAFPQELFEYLGEEQGIELWCFYLVGAGKRERWCCYDPRSHSWREKIPPPTFVMAVELLK